MTTEQIKALEAPFAASDVQWRVAASKEDRGRAVPYLDSRAVQNRLDAVLGKNGWENEFSCVATADAKEPLAVICEIRIFDAEANAWISKSDGAGCTDIEPVKGGLSDAFKRAASMWGCGRYMYGLPDVWVDIEISGKSKFIARKEQAKLNSVYEDAVAKIFGEKPSADSATKAEPSQPVFSVVSSSAQNNNTVVQLKKPEGGTIQAFIQGQVDLKKGQSLTDVKLTEKTNPKIGSYFIVSEYKLAA